MFSIPYSLFSFWYPYDVNVGILEGKQDTEELFEEIMMENFPNLVKEIDIQTWKAQSPKQEEPKEGHTKTHHN